jgi:drug/metabolite transporter (DMT)-like permease
VLIGTLFALAAGLLWGLVFVAPLLLPDYPATLLSAARYFAFGLIALPLATWDRAELARLTRADWLEALKLSTIGNLLYYLCLAAAIQRAGAPLPTVIIGTLPVVIAIVSNLGWMNASPASRPAPGEGANSVRSRAQDAQAAARLPWGRLAPSLALIAAGVGLVNQAELAQLRSAPNADLGRYAMGALLALGAVICWTWYPIRNGQWLRAHTSRSPRAWATAQGLVTLPLSALALLAFWAYDALSGSGFDAPWGPTPALFLGLMFGIGLLASWLGTLCWNEASQRLPTTLAGQLIVFETLAALCYAWILGGRGPDAITLAGVALLVAGVLWALRRGAPAAAPA